MGQALTLAGSPAPQLTESPTRDTTPLSLGPYRSLIAEFLGSIDAVTAALIGFPITVIIQTIADLQDREDLSHTDSPSSKSASLKPRTTDPLLRQPRGALKALQIQILIDLTITVIVQTITALRRGEPRLCFTLKATPSWRTNHQPRGFAEPHPQTAWSTYVKALVDLTITVIIQAVTDLKTLYTGRKLALLPREIIDATLFLYSPLLQIPLFSLSVDPDLFFSVALIQIQTLILTKLLLKF